MSSMLRESPRCPFHNCCDLATIAGSWDNSLRHEGRTRTMTRRGPRLSSVLRQARSARFLAATARELPTLREAGVPLDLLVASVNDPGERYDRSLEVKTVVLTDGANGGTANGVPFAAVPAERVVDTYGAGDSFAAALAFALARGDALEDALGLGARAGSAVLGGSGPYAAQLA